MARQIEDSTRIRKKISANWPRLEAALRLIWRWRGVSKLEGALAEASGRLLSTERAASAG